MNMVHSSEIRQGISLASAVLEHDAYLPIARDSYRQQVDSMPKDFLSVQQVHVDPSNGSFYQPYGKLQIPYNFEICTLLPSN